MRTPTSRLYKRLPITAGVQPLAVHVYSDDAARRAAVIAALQSNRHFSADRDQVVELDSPQAAGATSLRDGCCLISDTQGSPPPADFVGERAPSAVVVTFGARVAEDTEIDGHMDFPPSPADVQRILRRARELAWLRGRAFSEGSQSGSRDRLVRLNRIGTALSDIRQLDELLEVVLTEARNILDADAGSIYIIERGTGAGASGRKVLGKAEKRTRAMAVRRADLTRQVFSLRFAAAQNDSVEIPFQQIVFPANMESIAGYAALTGEMVAIEDVYHLPESAPYRFNNSIDVKYGYHTRSMLTVPLKNTSDEVVGVVQLINRKRDPRRRLTPDETDKLVLPFSEEDLQIAASLSSQAGVAIENVRLLDAIANLFERFVIACVGAIEQRDPSTAGHSGRVDRITMALADEVNKDKSGTFRDVSFTDEEMTELHYAGLLHDFGKIGVREHVLQKAEKLYPSQQQAIEFRGEIVRREIRLDALEREARLIAEGRQAEVPALRQVMQADLARLDSDVKFLLEHSKPLFMTDEKLARLKSIHDNPWRFNGDTFALLNEEDYLSLQTRKGTLNDAERREIENHVADSWAFLKRIPWTPDLARVPEIAGQHHEKMNSKGYPNGVPAAETPLGSRLMAVADVFDSLTASDRPYKPAIPLERAIQILQAMAKDGDLDPEVVDLFVNTKIWEKLKLKVVRMDNATEAQKAAR
ncbi:MAG: GAF domain-containing protein [Planctomycetes bacterium]|nr:GAF domain-containing protein [Planctomycetota bacterium]